MSGGFYPPPAPPGAPPAFPGPPLAPPGPPHNPSIMLPPMPHPWDPMYAAWYSQWYYATQGGYAAPQFSGPPPAAPPPPVPGTDQPPPPGFDDDPAQPPPAKKPHVDLACPPPPPPEDKTPSWQAAKKGAVIYKTPRPPTPEPPKPAPEPTILEPPKLVENIQLAGPKKMQWFHDGETWVYAKEPPEMKPPKPPEEWPEFKYSSARSEDPVGKAFMANMKGKYLKPEKPKAVPVRCDVCSLTVSCQATYESHIAGKPHRKRAAQTEKVKQLQEKVAQANSPEKTVNVSNPQSLERPNNPLQSQPNGDIHCTVCDCTMNSGAQAQSHIAGVKHRSKMERTMRSFRGRGRGFGAQRGFGRGAGGPRLVVPPLEKQQAVCDEDEANEEYERVFNEALADNIDVEEAKSRAEAAKQAALSVLGPTENEVQTQRTVQYIPQLEEDEDDEEDEDNVMIGIDIITAPDGATSGTYRCNCCGVMLTSEENLKIHLETAAHQMFIEGRKKAIKQIKIEKQAQSQRGSTSRGRVYRGRANAHQEGSMKAQRGRRGLISYGETMPDKLTKGQKKAQPKDIAELLARKSAEVGIAAGAGEIKKVAPLLMNFVRGGVMEGNQ